jgi:hypothetical protein
MTVPRRWADSPDAPDGVRDLFAAGRRTRAMSPEARARLGSRLAKPLAAAVVTNYVAGWKAMAFAAGLGLTATAGVVVATRAARAPSIAAESPSTGAHSRRAPVPVERPATAQPVARPESPAVPPPAIVASATPEVPRVKASVGTAALPSSGLPQATLDLPVEAVAPAVATDTLGAELKLLEEARAHYASDPQATLDRLDEHARRFPDGKLSSERELLALDALQRLGRVDDERARAERLLPTVRGTIYENRVRTHLGTER